MSSWTHATVSGVVQLVGLPVCSSLSTDVWPVLNWACQWNICVWLKIWSPKACCITVRVSVALFPKWHKVWCTLNVPLSDPSWKLPMSTQLHATWNTDSLDMVVLPSTGTSCYHNCCVDGSTSLEYFVYHLVWWTLYHAAHADYPFPCPSLHLWT
jgi:hypothetical protein